MTYRELIAWAEANTNITNPEFTLGQMMDVVEEQTGTWPNWGDQVPEWIMNEFGANPVSDGWDRWECEPSRDDWDYVESNTSPY